MAGSGRIARRLAGMHPAYFAMPMATGIVSIASHLLGLAEFAQALLWINRGAFLGLSVLFVLRAVLFPERVLADLKSHQRGPGFFTLAAATGVVGSQAVLLDGNLALARSLWWVSLVLWAGCTYGVFTLLTIGRQKPSLAEGINGGWLLAVVATQSVCVLGCLAGPDLLGGRETSLFLLMCFWLCGGMLYLWTISLIFYRYMFFEFSPADLMPPYWINMGAVAISTLAGALLANAARDSSRLGALLPFITGLTVLFWATATWWIPMLLILGIWRHHVMRFRVAYDPLYWGLVFPLGMYSACTYRLAGLLDAPMLIWIAKVFVVIALVAWLLTFFGMGGRLLYLLLLGLRMARLSGPYGRQSPAASVR